jgi:hypothetical protein
MIKICAVMPTFGLEKGTERTAAVRAHLFRLRETLKRQGNSNRLMLVNDEPATRNQTSAVLADFGLRELIEQRAPAGQGIGFCRFYGARQALARTDADLVVIMNDNSSFHLPEFTADIARHFAANRWDMAVGARTGKSMTMDNFPLPMLATETKINFRAASLFDLFQLFPDGYPDLVSGISAISRQGMEGFDRACSEIGVDVLELLPALRHGYDIFVPILFHLLGFRVGAVPFDPPVYFKDPANKAAEHLDPAQFLMRDQHFANHEKALRRLLEINSRCQLAKLDATSGPVYDLDRRLRSEGLGEFIRPLSPGLFNRIVSLELDLSESENPDLRQSSAGQTTVTVHDVMTRLNILDHTVEIYKSLQRFRSASPASPEIAALLEKVCAEPAVARAFYAAIMIHDLGKFTRQANHFEHTFQLIRNNRPLRSELAAALSPAELEITEVVARYHSLYSDTMICKERDILFPYRVVIESPLTPDRQLLVNDLLLAMSVLDTDAYLPGESRLTPERLAELWALRNGIRQAVEAGRSIADLAASTDTIRLDWGWRRFNSWVQAGDDPGRDRELAQAELSRLLPAAEARRSFASRLGSLKFVGLIFDLRKELESPAARTRLLFWLCQLAEARQEDSFEFRLYREKGKWVGPQVGLLNELLKRPDYRQQLDETLKFQKNSDGVIEIILA